MRVLELKVPPLILVGVFAAAMYGVSILIPSARFPTPAWPLAAVAVASTGGLIALAGVLRFRASQTTVNPLTPAASTMLVCSGVYRYSRNPMYLGFLLCLIGWALHLSNSLSTLLLPLFVAYMNRFQIEPEERALYAKFGPSFTEYTRTVRRWI